MMQEKKYVVRGRVHIFPKNAKHYWKTWQRSLNNKKEAFSMARQIGTSAIILRNKDHKILFDTEHYIKYSRDGKTIFMKDKKR